MKIPSVMIAAPSSGSGKTTITCALIGALKSRGLNVRARKCGPDYIDPMYHREMLGVPSGNLDLFFTDAATTKRLFETDADCDITIVEGVMGLYDGLGGISEEASSYHLAQTLDIPIILVVDVHGMGRSAIAMIKGFLLMDSSKLIKGVILNRVSSSFYKSLKTLIESELDVEVLGYFDKQKDIKIESRYLGLLLPGEVDGIKANLKKASNILKESVDIGRILELSNEKADLERSEAEKKQAEQTVKSSENCQDKKCGTQKIRIAVARDEAFCFYYEENLKLLKQLGAELVTFSPIYDKAIPDNVNGLLLGGGYPEKYAAELSGNQTMLKSIREAIDSGMPSLAECGGFMYLHDEISDENGKTHKMAGVIPGSCDYTGKLVRFGYISIEDCSGTFLDSKNCIRGHEFHYYDSSNNGNSAKAKKPINGRNWDCCHISENHWWGFAHLYYESCPEFVEHFVEYCNKYMVLY